MYDVILQTAGLIVCGVLWQLFRPQGLDADVLRRSLTTLVYVVLLPSLVLVVLWRAQLSLDSVRVAVTAMLGLATGFAVAWLWFLHKRPASAALGALLLAATFPNVTYMGLPVLEATLGSWSRSIAIQYDLFANTPVLFTLGVMVAYHFGSSGERIHPVKNLFTILPLWAAVLGVALNLLQVPVPVVLGGMLDMLAAGVVPLMLISLGLSLRWGSGWGARLGQVMPVVVIQLLVTPLVIWWVSGVIGLTGEVRVAVILEAAMPSMVLGIVLCDRYKLDSSLYAMAVTLSTALSAITLPLWFDWLG